VEPRILTPEQFLLTLLVRLAAIAVLATMLARFHRFRRILIFERRGWVDRLVFTLSIGMPLMAGVTSRVILKYDVSTIAPYALGHVELKIPYPRLNGILKPELFPGRN